MRRGILFPKGHSHILIDSQMTYYSQEFPTFRGYGDLMKSFKYIHGRDVFGFIKVMKGVIYPGDRIIISFGIIIQSSEISNHS